MKEKDGYVDCPEQQLILYVEKEDGSYGPIQTGSYLTKNYIDDFFDKRKKLEESLRVRIDKGEISPVAFFMTLEDLSVSEMAGRIRTTKRRVKREMRPEFFGKIPLKKLQQYARVFNVSVTDMLALWRG
jgi:hypothetical protein